MIQSVHDYTEEDSMRNRMIFCFGIFFLFACLPVGIGLLLYWYWSDVKRMYGKEDMEKLKGKISDIKTEVLEEHK